MSATSFSRLFRNSVGSTFTLHGQGSYDSTYHNISPPVGGTVSPVGAPFGPPVASLQEDAEVWAKKNSFAMLESLIDLALRSRNAMCFWKRVASGLQMVCQPVFGTMGFSWWVAGA